MSGRPPVPALTAHRADEAPPAFECTWRDEGHDSTWVHVRGELDLAASPLLDQTLRRVELRARMVVLDLRDVTFMDSAGLHVILDADARARLLTRRFVLVRGCRQVDRLLALTGASQTLEIGDLGPVEPPARVVLQLAVEERPR